MYAAAQVAEVLESLQSASAFHGQVGQRWSQQVTERLTVATTHTATHLVQVGESEVVGSVDDDGVGVGYVDAVLDDGRRQQHVVVVVGKVEDNLLQFLGLHLTVSHRYACVRHVLIDNLLDALQVVDARIDEVHLTIARQLEVDGVGNDFGAEGVNLRLDGVAVGRRRLDNAQVAGTNQRELQRPRYGRGRHRQRVDVGLHLAQLLFGGDAELLFLVDDEQSEVVEVYALADELVRTYQDVYLAVFQVFQYLFRLLCAACSRQVFHTNGQVLQSRRECLVVLEGQHRGRHQHGYLLGVACSLEGSTYGHLGLAEAHVATDQTVHGLCLLHVGLHVVGGFQLVGSVFVEERGLQFMLHKVVG